MTLQGLASNLCILGVGYVISVVFYLFRRWAITEERRREWRGL